MGAAIGRTVRSSRFAQQLRLASGLRRFVASPISVAAATRELRSRLAGRNDAFLAVLRELVYASGPSPYRALLAAAGCAYGDLERSVRQDGIEATLALLAQDGVFVSLDELKGRRPIERPGLTLDTRDTSFDSPLFLGRAIHGATSGTSGRPSRVRVDWDGLAEEAVNELLLYAAHGLERAPLALWLPDLPALAGIRNVLINVKMGRPPVCWYTVSATSRSLGDRVRSAYLISACRRAGARAPWPTPLPLAEAERLARWLGSGEQRVLRTFTARAVRVAAAAVDAGVELGGSVVFAAGEPLTERQRRFIESSGLRAYSRYVTSESGVIAGGCPEACVADEMHLYTDRIAAIEYDGRLLFTALTLNGGKVLLNAELGDTARLERRRCGCLLGELGLDTSVSTIRSAKLLTGEGMTILVRDLEEIVGAVVERAGGRPDDYQLWESRPGDGATRLVLAVSPEVRVEGESVVAAVLDGLRSLGPAGRVAADAWREARTIEVVRERPRAGTTGKLASVIRRP